MAGIAAFHRTCVEEAAGVFAALVVIARTSISAEPCGGGRGVVGVDEAQLGIGFVDRHAGGCLHDVGPRRPPLVAGQAGSLDPCDRMHQSARECDFGDRGKPRVVAGAAIGNAAHIDRAVDNASFGAVEPVEITETFARMAGRAGSADLSVIVPVAKGLGRCVRVRGAEPVGDRLVVLDLDLCRIERAGLRQGKGY